MAVQFTFRIKDLQMLINGHPDARNIIVTYDEVSKTPYVGYAQQGETTTVEEGDEIFGCPYPPGCG